MSISAYVEQKEEEQRVTKASNELWQSQAKEILSLFTDLFKTHGYEYNETSKTDFLFINRSIDSKIEITFFVDLYLFAKIEVDTKVLGHIKIEQAPHNLHFTQCDEHINSLSITSADLSIIVNRMFRSA